MNSLPRRALLSAIAATSMLAATAAYGIVDAHPELGFPVGQGADRVVGDSTPLAPPRGTGSTEPAVSDRSDTSAPVDDTSLIPEASTGMIFLGLSGLAAAGRRPARPVPAMPRNR